MMPSMQRWNRALLALVATVLLASAAQARTEILRWQHGNPGEVARFTVHVGTSSGVYTQTIDVGKPSPQNGVYTASVTVGDTADVFVAVSARGTNGLTSAPSNERFRAAPSGPPPTTPLGQPGRPTLVAP